MMRNTMAAAALLLLVASGCGDSDDDKSASAEPTGDTTSQYVVKVNQLCTALVDDIVPITGDAARPTGEEYLADQPAVQAVWAEFDAEVDAIELKTDADREAAAAFDAIREAGEVADAALEAQRDQIAKMDATEFEAALDKALNESGWVLKRDDLTAVGIQCPAR